jgi:hypothetical protein
MKIETVSALWIEQPGGGEWMTEVTIDLRPGDQAEFIVVDDGTGPRAWVEIKRANFFKRQSTRIRAIASGKRAGHMEIERR